MHLPWVALPPCCCLEVCLSGLEVGRHCAREVCPSGLEAGRHCAREVCPSGPKAGRHCVREVCPSGLEGASASLVVEKASCLQGGSVGEGQAAWDAVGRDGL